MDTINLVFQNDKLGNRVICYKFRAVAQQDVSMVNRLIDACADVDEEYMIRETPIQVAAVLGDFEIATRLVNCGANPYLSTINYDSLKCNFRNFGAPSVRNF